MLSIVKMEIDDSDQSDMDLLEERREEIINIFDKLQQIPVVYTTRLDDMPVLQYTTYPILADPRDICANILQQSKPKLRTLPINKPRRSKKRFQEMKAYLQEIYAISKKNIGFDPAAESSEEIKEPPDTSTKPVENKATHKTTTESTKPAEPCHVQYIDLLKVCKPCSVVLPRIGWKPSNAVIHGGQVLKVNKVQKPKSPTVNKDPSSDEELPLITLKPEMFDIRKDIRAAEESDVNPNDGNTSSGNEKVSMLRLIMYNKNDISQIGQRVLRSVVLEFVDRFSKEYSLYFIDDDCNVIDYFKDTSDKAHLYRYKHPGSPRYALYNCCWVKRVGTLQNLNLKGLTNLSLRFMSRPHPCISGACVCCCRKNIYIEKPRLVASNHPTVSGNWKTLDKEDMEIQDLEEKIQKSVININTITPKRNSSEWLRRLTRSRNQSQNNLIGRALSFTKPLPKEAKDNRRLETVNKAESQNSILILRNFSKDIIEVYETNSSSNIETSLITTCSDNVCQLGVKNFLNNPDAIDITVCCWFKRDTIISSLQHRKNFSCSAIKFIRSKHPCPTNECSCCCKPKPKRKYKLLDLVISSRTHGPTKLNNIDPSPDFQPQVISSFSLAPQSAQFQLEPPPLIPLSSKTSTHLDDDCQITSVITSSSLEPPQNPTVSIASTVSAPTIITTPTNILVPGNIVDSEEMSQEVNSLIASILDRFKDVRLTINSDGKVAAALNTPVNALSTVELKVLANILSFAQSQVNLLGSKSNLNSGMSLSNIINLRVDDVQNSTLDPKVVYKEFGKNIKGNEVTRQLHNKLVTSLPIVPHPTPKQTYAYFSNSTSFRNEYLNKAFSSFITTTTEPKPPIPTETSTPIIESVFSLNTDDVGSSSTKVWFKNHIQSENTIKKYSNNSQKRKDNEPSISNPKKIKVISPSKLGATATNGTTPIIHNAMHQDVTVGGILPAVPLLSNNNIQIISSSQAIPSSNSTPSTSQPILIINPLNMSSLINTSTVSETITNNTLEVEDVTNISHPQLKIPIQTDTMPDTETSKAITSEDGAETGVESVNNQIDERSSIHTLHTSIDIDTKLEYSDEEPGEETEDNPEEYNCDDEVCILGV